MTDNTDKTVVDIEADAPEVSESPAPAEDVTAEAEEKPKGAGFVWLLALVLVVAYGGYAAWPYLGDDVHKTAEPYIQKAKSFMGLERRPTQPTLPRETADTRVEQPKAAPQPVPQSVPQPAPTYAPQEPPVPAPAPVEPVVSAPAPQTPAETEALAQRLQELESQVQNQPSAPVGEDIQPMMQGLTDRLNMLEQQLSTQAQSGDDGAKLSNEATAHISALIADLRADMATLKTRVSTVETQPRAIDPTASSQALILSVTQLDSAIDRAAPFAQQLMALERIAGADPVVATASARLKPFADRGVPTQAELVDGFKPVAVAVMKAHNAEERDGWLDEVTGTLSNLVVVRQTDPARIDDPVERALAIAELALSKRDMPTAVAALNELHGAEAQAAQGWLQMANARAEALDALAVLHSHALAALAATGAR
ncbi:mitofilin family membrane protein [Magnetovibrio sp. PR-2]|uniref:COG4223 family protein n=1 Tax=Magnetovibrio sp. PR-2 TaxID=3120356 RepID=UPI002FCE03AE